jgi:hypothetical protein
MENVLYVLYVKLPNHNLIEMNEIGKQLNKRIFNSVIVIAHVITLMASKES